MLQGKEDFQEFKKQLADRESERLKEKDELQQQKTDLEKPPNSGMYLNNNYSLIVLRVDSKALTLVELVSLSYKWPNG